jgi:hypothetical protein
MRQAVSSDARLSQQRLGIRILGSPLCSVCSRGLVGWVPMAVRVGGFGAR